jgi:hypothetical protein
LPVAFSKYHLAQRHRLAQPAHHLFLNCPAEPVGQVYPQQLGTGPAQSATGHVGLGGKKPTVKAFAGSEGSQPLGAIVLCQHDLAKLAR